MRLSAPEPITAQHELGSFTCGEESLDFWIRHRALKNQATGASRTFVVCEGRRVLAYYALAASAIACANAAGRFRRNMPDPIPVVILGRLAVDQACQGKGWGWALVHDAALRILQAADVIGIRGVIVQAASGSAKAFYEKMGFDASPLDPMTLLLTLEDLRASLLPDPAESNFQ